MKTTTSNILMILLLLLLSAASIGEIYLAYVLLDYGAVGIYTFISIYNLIVYSGYLIALVCFIIYFIIDIIKEQKSLKFINQNTEME